MKALVTGGGGFLGKRVVELLLEAGHEVRFMARGSYPEVEALGAEGFVADLRDPEAVLTATQGVDTVFHIASKAGFWGPREAFYATNVLGTEHVIAAARACGVKRLIYTSTPSVIGYATDACGIASAPYPNQWESAYGETKALAEQKVLAANGDGLATVSLRPHLIIGPGDNHLLPRVIARARKRRLIQVGPGHNRVDLTYVDNAAWAHLDAADALGRTDAPCAGKAYFLSNGEPVSLWGWVSEVLEALDIPPIPRVWPLARAHRVGTACALAWRWLPLPGEPPMTPFLAAVLAKEHYYDIGPLQRDTGYRVRVPMADATAKTVAWLKASAS